MMKFRGFNPQQKQLIAQKMGYEGDMAGFDGYLKADPRQASRYDRFINKAHSQGKQLSSGLPPPPTFAPPDNQMFTQGGKVVDQSVQDPMMQQEQPVKNSGVVAPPRPTISPSMYPAPSFPQNFPQTVPPTDISPMGYAKGGDVKDNKKGEGKQGKREDKWDNTRDKDSKTTKDDKQRNDQKDIRDNPNKDKNKGNGGNGGGGGNKPDAPSKDWKDDLEQPTKGAINNPEKQITKVETEDVKVKDGQFISNDGNVVKNIPQVDAATVKNADQGQVSTAEAPQQTDTHTVTTDKVTDDVKGVVDNTNAAQGTVSDKAQVKAATALPSANATVQGQLESLMKQFEGGETPAWAAGAMRMANTAMAARGLGSSSMAGAAVTQAAMESAISIAAQDAATFSQFEMQNLNNRQQARLQNAQAFLQMDLTNLNNRQQTELFKSQAMIQSMFTDQAAENATRQFNASSQNQADQFFANLKSQVATFNAAQKNAMEQFNVGESNDIKQFNAVQKNATRQFNATIKADIQKFNAQNRLIIDQSNAEWRRQIATVNNANQNEANRINAQAATGLTMAGYNNLWQTQRDLMAYAFTAGENMQQRAHEVVLAQMGADLQSDLMDEQQNNAMWEAAGGVVASLFDGLF